MMAADGRWAYYIIITIFLRGTRKSYKSIFQSKGLILHMQILWFYLATTRLHVRVTQQVHATDNEIVSQTETKREVDCQIGMEKVFHIVYHELIEPNYKRRQQWGMTMHSITQKQQHQWHSCGAKYEQSKATMGPSKKGVHE